GESCRLLVEELRIGVEVQQASSDCAVRLLPLFGVPGNKHAGDWLATPISLQQASNAELMEGGRAEREASPERC
ncbi:hypothetical protein INR49_001455, partial [Caranx melampygus]